MLLASFAPRDSGGLGVGWGQIGRGPPERTWHHYQHEPGKLRYMSLVSAPPPPASYSHQLRVVCTLMHSDMELGARGGRSEGCPVHPDPDAPPMPAPRAPPSYGALFAGHPSLPPAPPPPQCSCPPAAALWPGQSVVVELPSHVGWLSRQTVRPTEAWDLKAALARKLVPAVQWSSNPGRPGACDRWVEEGLVQLQSGIFFFCADFTQVNKLAGAPAAGAPPFWRVPPHLREQIVADGGPANTMRPFLDDSTRIEPDDARPERQIFGPRFPRANNGDRHVFFCVDTKAMHYHDAAEREANPLRADRRYQIDYRAH